MSRILGRHADRIYALFRIVTGLLFSLPRHAEAGRGVRLRGTPPVGSLAWFAGVIELGCRPLVMIGLLASWAAFLASGIMAVAYFMAHFKPQAFWPIQNQGELAVIYCFAFLYIAARGAGPWSVAWALKNPSLE